MQKQCESVGLIKDYSNKITPADILTSLTFTRVTLRACTCTMLLCSKWSRVMHMLGKFDVYHLVCANIFSSTLWFCIKPLTIVCIFLYITKLETSTLKMSWAALANTLNLLLWHLPHQDWWQCIYLHTICDKIVFIIVGRARYQKITLIIYQVVLWKK